MAKLPVGQELLTTLADFEARLVSVEKRLSALGDCTTVPSVKAINVVASATSLAPFHSAPQLPPAKGDQTGNEDPVQLEAERGKTLEYTLGDTLWDAPAILGLRDLGGTEISVILLMSTLLNAFAQLYLVGVLINSDSFVRSDKWVRLLASTRRWRDNEAHQYNQVDASGTSLGARVCGLDDALSTSGKQSGMLTEINTYLGLSGRDMETKMFSTGPWLCSVCLFLWAVVIAKELRALVTSTIAICSLPRGKHTLLQDGAFVAISLPRTIGVLLMALVRCFVALALLYAGMFWLANTSSVVDLILNAAALNFVMDLDELLLQTTVPAAVHRFMGDLQPLQYRSPVFYIEALLPTAFVLAAVGAGVGGLVMPNAVDMLAVKREMCGGPVNFAVDKTVAGFAVVTKTSEFVAASSSDQLFGIAEKAVQQVRLNSADDSGNLKTDFAYFAPTPIAFTTFLERTVADFAGVGGCFDKDKMLGGGLLQQVPWWFTTLSWVAGRSADYQPKSWTCADYIPFCDDENLARVICPMTCGCHIPTSGLLVDTAELGVPPMCSMMHKKALLSSPCVDLNVTGMPQWQRWWKAYVRHVANRFPDITRNQSYQTFIQRKMMAGCADMTPDPVAGTEFCDESSYGLFSMRSVRAFCPATCCQSDPTHANCPLSCRQR